MQLYDIACNNYKPKVAQFLSLI